VSADERAPEYYREERGIRTRTYRYWIDRVRWGPVWAGLVVALSTYLLIQLGLVATDAVDLADPSTSDAVLSAIAAVIGFFLGGLIVGATSMWRGIEDGILHGVVLWAAGLVALLTLATVGGGIALGSIDTSDAFEDIQQQADTDPAQANEDAQDSAGRALAVIAAALVASAAGGAAGAKLWPQRDDDVIDLRTSRSRVDTSID
jgi:hypothetical protein